jgi:hypothetical protein
MHTDGTATGKIEVLPGVSPLLDQILNSYTKSTLHYIFIMQPTLTAIMYRITGPATGFTDTVMRVTGTQELEIYALNRTACRQYGSEMQTKRFFTFLNSSPEMRVIS